MPKGKRLCALLKTVLLRVYDYFDALEQRGGGRGALRRTTEATGEPTQYCSFVVRMFPLQYNTIGISESTIKRLRRERALSEADFSSPAKRYRVSRRRIVVDNFDREAIRRRIYQVYDSNEHLTLAKLLVRNYTFVFANLRSLLLLVM